MLAWLRETVLSVMKSYSIIKHAKSIIYFFLTVFKLAATRKKIRISGVEKRDITP